MSAVIVLFALVVLRWAVILIGIAVLVRPVRSCPACFEPTVGIRKWWLGRLVPRLEWRWCPACRWQGPSRIVRSRAANPNTFGRPRV